MRLDNIADLLKLDDFRKIYQEADKTRKQCVGDEIRIRAILEFSNYCKKDCEYCGLRCHNTNIGRYRMDPSEIIETALKAADAGYKTIVLQSGEDAYFTPQILGDITKKIKKSGMAVTLSSGEMSREDYAYLKECGADRYLLKHETADSLIYKNLHPNGTLEERINCLENIKSLGFETGSGFMIGLPGQTEKTIEKDILLLEKIGCDMAGIGPFIPHPDTPLGTLKCGSTELTKRAVAITRLVIPFANLPATTSLGVIAKDEKNDIFSCGANVIMQKVTPEKYLKFYEIYPSAIKPIDIRTGRKQLEQQIIDIGRIPD